MFRFLLISLLLTTCVFMANAQETSLRQKTITIHEGEEIKIDSLTIYPNSFHAYCGNRLLSHSEYDLNHTHGTFQLRTNCSESIRLEYRVFPINFTEKIQSRDTSLIYLEEKGDKQQFLTEAKYIDNDLFGNSRLDKSGSISRGISIGNSQDMAVTSSMNLELAGELAPNLKILASLSDANIPIQPDGNTNKLQEFDKIFIQLYNDNWKVIGGDFWLTKPKQGYFLNYHKKAQGIYGEYTWKTQKDNAWSVQGGGAFSRGKFNRQEIQGVEGNQGPYRLRGAENETFLIILSGTEKVYIDGELLKRGQEYDYVIDYNTAEIIFTSRKLITKDKRIIVEFQYSDQNYARSLFQASTSYEGKRLKFWLNAYSEQDAKNQSIQQTLSMQQKQYLSTIGDRLDLASISSIDSIGYAENQNMYRLVDTLGYDSVLVYSIDENVAKFAAVFTEVGDNQGDYVLKQYTALGKVFEWVQPIGGIPQGNFQAKRIIVTPKMRQMVASGASYQIGKNVLVSSEFAYSNNDVNTFSKLDSKDNQGVSNKTQITGLFALSKDSIPKWKLETKGQFEALSPYFQYIENYRPVEYDRDWNVKNQGYGGTQLLSNIDLDFKHIRNGHFLFNASQYNIGKDYAGYKGGVAGQWLQKGFNIRYEGSYLGSQAQNFQSEFIRNKTDLSQDIKVIRLGFRNEFERNIFRDSIGTAANSYQFIDYEFYLTNVDTSKNQYRVFYKERYDQKVNSGSLTPTTTARNIGAEFNMNQVKNQQLTLLANYRSLQINDSILAQQTPENTLLGRIDYQLHLFKKAITWNTFYEVGSGLEQRQEFQYIKVADGQGIYAWIDYNGDGIKDLNEFEIAQFPDQASYIRVYTQSNQYTKSYSNEFNQTISLQPNRVWRNSTNKTKKFFARFSDQARFRIYRKTNQFDKSSFNPFDARVSDTTLVSTNSTIRNTLAFNRTSAIFGTEYTFQDIRNKILLANGFDARTDRYHEVKFHVNIKRQFTIDNLVQYGNKTATADYTSGRDFNYNYWLVKPSLSFQPSTRLRLTFETRITDKQNIDTTHAFIQSYSLKLKWNQSSKGSLQADFSYIKIQYNGLENSALGYEMLESLRAGNNFTWSVGYQYNISNNLQLSIHYNARKTQGTKVIHTGGMEVRAFF